jgi:UDP-N-acetylmuramoyl-tripeptide--D-alanyl-D-alanine ligase
VRAFEFGEACAAIPELENAARGLSGRVTAVVTDSRLAGPGTIFIALEGERGDGHQFVPDALARGALACIVRRGAVPRGAAAGRAIEVTEPLAVLGAIARFVRNRLACTVMAITGSIGKTTTKELLAAVLGHRFRTEKAPESFNNSIGVPLTVFRAAADTQYLVAEVGANHPGEISELAAILNPTVGMIVSIAPVHLEGFGSIAGVIEAKGELAAALPAGGALYLPADIPGLESFRRRTRARVKLFGEGAEIRGELVEADGRGLGFRVPGAGEFFLPGAFRHHLRSAVGVIAVALDCGLAPAEIREALRAFTFPRLRWQEEAVGGATFVLDCYNASPDAVHGALDAAAAVAGGRRRLFAVLGDMRELGAWSERYHQELGEDLAGRPIARVFLCGQEVAATYEALARRGCAGRAELYHEDRDRMACDIARAVRPGDVVLFKGSRKLKLEEVARKVKEIVNNGSPATQAR